MTGALPAGIVLRDAGPDDAEAVFALVRRLAEYERLSHELRSCAADFAAALSGPAPAAHAILAERGGAAVGLALYYPTFSTFTGRPGLWLEDLFVVPEARRLGLGRALFRALAARARGLGCARLEWSVLDWNTPAHDFYRAIGARPRAGWTTQRLDGDALAALACDA